MKLKLLALTAALFSALSIGSYIQLPSTSGGGGGSGDVVGPASSTDDSVCTFDGVTGKLIQDPTQFYINNTEDDLLCATGQRCNSKMTSQTVLDDEKAFRLAAGTSTDIKGNFYAQNSAGSKSVRLGTTITTAGTPGLIYYHAASDYFALLGTASLTGGVNIGAKYGELTSTDSDIALFHNRPGSGTPVSLGLPSMAFLKHGSIWLFADGASASSYPVIITQAPSNNYGTVISYKGQEMDDVADGNPEGVTKGYDLTFQAGNYTDGTNNGGDLILNGGTSFAGIGGEARLTGGTGTGAQGGAVTVSGGAGAGGSGTALIKGADGAVAGGAFTARGGDSSASVGGAATVRGGDSSSGAGGALTLRGGEGTTEGGAVQVLGGNGGTLDGGDLSLEGGESTARNGGSVSVIAKESAGAFNGGALEFISGDADTGDGGEITILAGNSSGGGNGGNISMTAGTGAAAGKILAESVLQLDSKLDCKSGNRCNALMATETALDDYRTWLTGLAQPHPTGIFSIDSAASSSRAVYLGASTGTTSGASASGYPGLTYWDGTADARVQLQMRDSGLSSFLPGGASGAYEMHLTRNASAASATTLYTHSFTPAGHIWIQNPGAGSFSDNAGYYFTDALDDDEYGSVDMRGLILYNDGTADAGQAPSVTLQASSKTAGTGGGGDVTITAGDGFGGGADGSVLVTGNLKMQASQSSMAQDDNSGAGTGTAFTVNWNTGNAQVIDLQDFSGDVTLTLSNPLTGASYAIEFIQGSTARNVIWPGTVTWPGGMAPTISTADNAVDLVTLYWNGTSYRATYAQDFQ